MKSSLLLACLPAVLATQLAYTPPAALAAKAKDSSNNCVLPADFHVRDFSATTNSTGNSLSSFNFTYVNTVTNSSTACEYGPRSTAQAPGNGGRVPRYACRDDDVSFIWQHGPKKLSLIQKVCPDSKGNAEYEAAGDLIVPLSCGQNACRTNATDYTGVFTSLNPVRHRRAIRHHARGVAWSFGLAG
jgi:hypothetical protein